MYLEQSKIVKEDDLSAPIYTEDDEVLESELYLKIVDYEKKYSQDEVCEDAKNEVFNM